MNIKSIWNDYIIDNYKKEDWLGQILLGNLMIGLLASLLSLILLFGILCRSNL